MAQLNFHPAVGFGDLMPGWHVVPQNPILTGGTPLVPSIQATAPGRVMRRGKLAELMPGGFSVPQNPLRQALGGMGCGCGGNCNGMGQLDTSSVGGFFSSIPNWLTEPSSIFPGVANWVLFGGVAIALDLYLGKRGRR